MLQLKNLSASYDQIEVLHDINIQVKKGEVVSILGANGGGVTVHSGSVLFKDLNITQWLTHKRVRQKIAHVPENRRVFKNLSVVDNLLLGGMHFLNRHEMEQQMNEVFVYFPRLQERKGQLAGTLSGGEQQMLAIGRALMMMKPELMILDEPSQGLAPLVVERYSM